MKYVLGFCLPFVVVYLLSAFISLSFNPAEWTGEGRFFAVLVALFGAGFTTSFLLELE